MIIIVDFGSQTCHLIARRIQDLGIKTVIINPENALNEITKVRPKGIIFSGGPASVYEKGAPTIDKKVFSLKIPILGICYGEQLTAHLLPGGKTVKGKKREDGPATLIIDKPSLLLESISEHSRIWMSHGDTVIRPPTGFSFIAHSETIKSAAIANEDKKIYGVQFHPEVEHTEHGELILRNFVEKICRIKTAKKEINIAELINHIKDTVGENKAIAAVSGGLDSTLAATLVFRAIGKQLIPIHVESGLMREGTTKLVRDYFTKYLGIKPIVLRKQLLFLRRLRNITSPEKKRKIIGKLYIDLFKKEMGKYKDVKFLVQGTIYSDVIESKGTKHAAKIKSHHNVGGLPHNLNLTLIEPLRQFYTDQVREIARKVGIPEKIVSQQPHPGPGYSIRIIGKITPKRLKMMQKTDSIIVEEMKQGGWYDKLLHSFPILTGIKSTSVKGDGRVYGEVVALRTIVSRDRMTADWARLPYELLQKIVSRITNEIPGISRVVYDITTKPPATMEWE